MYTKLRPALEKAEMMGAMEGGGVIFALVALERLVRKKQKAVCSDVKLIF